jgi:dolichol-phosphate mannosyltransferase
MMNVTADIPVDCSIVIPVYYNQGELTETLASLKREVIDRYPSRRFEVVFIDDGSGDGSFDELMELRTAYPELLKVIKLTRNFGQIHAVTAGYVHSRGRCVVTMSADGQDPVRLINDMLAAYFDEGYEVVVCTRKGRDESFYRIFTSKIFYGLMRRLTFKEIPPGGFDFVLMSRKVVNVFLRNLDSNPFFQGQLLWMGFRTKFIEYQRLSRKVGQSRWTFAKKLTFLIDGMMSFSFFPIRVISAAGIIVALLGFLYALWITVGWFIWGTPVKGWAPIMIMILLMGGFQMLMLGVVGEYLWRTLSQVRNRDRYIIESIHDERGADYEVYPSYPETVEVNRFG